VQQGEGAEAPPQQQHVVLIQVLLGDQQLACEASQFSKNGNDQFLNMAMASF